MNRKNHFYNAQDYTDDLRNQILDTINVSRAGYGTWMITAQCIDVNGDVHDLKMITHNEEDKTGIFDGEKYNPLCGFHTMKDLEDDAEFYEMTMEEYQDNTWQDSANEDNYEPISERNERLTDKLWVHYEDLIIGLIEDFRGDC